MTVILATTVHPNLFLCLFFVRQQVLVWLVLHLLNSLELRSRLQGHLLWQSHLQFFSGRPFEQLQSIFFLLTILAENQQLFLSNAQATTFQLTHECWHSCKLPVHDCNSDRTSVPKRHVMGGHKHMFGIIMIPVTQDLKKIPQCRMSDCNNFSDKSPIRLRQLPALTNAISLMMDKTFTKRCQHFKAGVKRFKGNELELWHWQKKQHAIFIVSKEDNNIVSVAWMQHKLGGKKLWSNCWTHF